MVYLALLIKRDPPALQINKIVEQGHRSSVVDEGVNRNHNHVYRDDDCCRTIPQGKELSLSLPIGTCQWLRVINNLDPAP